MSEQNEGSMFSPKKNQTKKKPLSFDKKLDINLDKAEKSSDKFDLYILEGKLGFNKAKVEEEAKKKTKKTDKKFDIKPIVSKIKDNPRLTDLEKIENLNWLEWIVDKVKGAVAGVFHLHDALDVTQDIIDTQKELEDERKKKDQKPYYKKDGNEWRSEGYKKAYKNGTLDPSTVGQRKK